MNVRSFSSDNKCVNLIFINSRVVDQFQMFQRLEVIACDGSCVNYEASLIALVLLCSSLDIGVARLQPTPCACISVLSLVAFLTELQQRCQVRI